MGDAAAAAAGSGGDGGAAAAAAVPAASAAKPWYDGKADAELVGHMQNNGWDKDPVEAAIAAAKSHREAQKKLGIPPDQILRMPKADSPEADLKAFWGKLGAPDDPKGYDFTGIKYADGTDIEPEFAAALRSTFAKRLVPKDTAIEIAKDLAKFADGDEAQQAAAKTAKIATEKAALQTEWKQDYDGNLFIAKRGAQVSGLTPEEVNSLEGMVGYVKTMKIMHQLGTINAEKNGLIGGGGDHRGAMTREQAIARKADLMKDAAFVARYQAGGVTEKDQLNSLMRIEVGDFTTPMA